MLKRLSIITLLISMGCPFAFSEASRPNRDLGRAYEMLEKYFKSMDGGYRRLFQDYLSDAAASGDEVAEYDYYHFYRYKKYKDTELADIRLNDSLAIVYLKDAVAKDYLPACGEYGILLSNKYEPFKQYGIQYNKDLAFNYLKKAESINNPQVNLALADIYYSYGDSVYDCYKEAHTRYCALEQVKDYQWISRLNQARTNFKLRDYKTSSLLFKSILEKREKETKKLVDKKYTRLDDVFDVSFSNTDLIYAIESFVQVENYDALNLIPFRDGVRPAKVKFDFKSWKSTDRDFESKQNLRGLADKYLYKYCETDISRSAYINELREMKCFPLFFSANNNPEGYDCHIMARYHRLIGDHAKEIEYLKKGVEKSHLPSAVLLSTYYYYGTDYITVDKEASFKSLMSCVNGLTDASAGRQDRARLISCWLNCIIQMIFLVQMIQCL